MVVTREVSHPEMSPSKEAAPSNMWDMSVTLDRTGASTARYSMLEAPANAPLMLVQEIVPHWSMDRSCRALSCSAVVPDEPPFRRILSKSPVMVTV